MLYLLRHLLSIAILPFTITVLVPRWIARRYDVGVTWPASAVDWTAATAGGALVGVGLLLFAASLRMFFTAGRGTLAPWDPPRRLVVSGPYRYVRNPMISGVVLILFGTALCLRSMPHAAWAAIFLAANIVWFPIVEEPMLEEQFGEEYRTYRRNVPRFVPRLRAWNG
jgi:protein-S-isoprenylcysteine O-methyltransferase Ste14